MTGRDRTNSWLGAGAALGALVAGLGLVRPSEESPGTPSDADAVAWVNGEPIPRATYDRALRAVAVDRAAPPDDALRAHVLERLVDEELLVQAALEQGLARTDPRVRADLSAAAIGIVTRTPAIEAPPTEAELRAFFAEHEAYFAPDTAVRVTPLFFAVRGDDPAARARADAARAALTDGGAPTRAEAEAAAMADEPAVAVPRAELSVQKLTQYLGPTVARAAGMLPVGTWSEPLRGQDGYVLLRVDARRPGRAPRFEEARSAVSAEWARRADERRLRAFLAARRREAVIRREGAR
jgi:hypothetical protein